MAYPSVSAGDEILEAHYNAIVGSLTGQSSKGQQILLTDYSSDSNYAFTVKNPGTGGLGGRFQASNGNDIGLFNDAASTLKSKDGTRYVVVSNSGVAVTAPSATFSINGQSVGAGYQVYNVLDYGLVSGSSSSNAAANTTAFQTLWATVADAGGGVIYFPAGFWSLNATTLNHANGSGASSAISVLGAGGATLLYFHGTTGPFLNIASSSDSPINYGFFRDFQLRHNDTVTSGATLQLGYVGNYLFENIRSIYSDSAKASATSVRLIASASFLKFRGCKFSTRADASTLSGLVPIGLDVVVSTGTVGGLEFIDTQFNGCQDHSVGIRFVNTVGIDTVTFSGLCLVKDHETGIRFGFGNDNGGVANVIANGLIVDAITGQSVHYSPTYTAGVPPASASRSENHQYNGCWFSGNDYIFLIDNSGAATVRGIQIVGSYLSGGGTRSITVGGVVTELVINGNRITCDANAAGKVALDIGDGSNAVTDVTITGNRIAVAGSSADAVIRINAAVDSFTVVSNTLRRGADADGIINTPGTGTSKVVASNSWLA